MLRTASIRCGLRRWIWAVKNALANGLTVILDEHDYNACGNNAEECKPKLMAFWEQGAEHYKDAPNGVLFEILNEPNSQVNPELWNAWLREALAIIRKSNPSRNVVIGPASWNNIRYLDRLELPPGKRRPSSPWRSATGQLDLHAGQPCPTCAGRNGFSRITDDEMKLIMKHAVDHVYHLLLLREEDLVEFESKIRLGERYTAKWDEPQIPKRRRRGLVP